METFKAAKARLLNEFLQLGWTVTLSGPSGRLKTPHVTSPGGAPAGGTRLYFHPQSIYVSHSLGNMGPFTSGGVLSICSDYRNITATALIHDAKRYEDLT